MQRERHALAKASADPGRGNPGILRYTPARPSHGGHTVPLLGIVGNSQFA
jgi:hypothetical protein